MNRFFTDESSRVRVIPNPNGISSTIIGSPVSSNDVIPNHVKKNHFERLRKFAEHRKEDAKIKATKKQEKRDAEKRKLDFIRQKHEEFEHAKTIDYIPTLREQLSSQVSKNGSIPLTKNQRKQNQRHQEWLDSNAPITGHETIHHNDGSHEEIPIRTMHENLPVVHQEPVNNSELTDRQRLALAGLGRL